MGAILSFSIVLLFSIHGLAAGGGDSSGAAKKEEVKIPEEDDWAKQINSLNTKEAKVKNYRADIIRLIDEKKKAKTKKEQVDIIQQMIATQTELRKMAKKYNTQRVKIKYRFPGKGEYIKKKYLPYRVESIEELVETGSELDQNLSIVRKLIANKYKAFIGKDEAEKQKRGPASIKGKPVEEVKPRLDQKIIFEK